jgi:hypothetical protein
VSRLRTTMAGPVPTKQAVVEQVVVRGAQESSRSTEVTGAKASVIPWSTMPAGL